MPLFYLHLAVYHFPIPGVAIVMPFSRIVLGLHYGSPVLSSRCIVLVCIRYLLGSYAIDRGCALCSTGKIADIGNTCGLFSTGACGYEYSICIFVV